MLFATVNDLHLQKVFHFFGAPVLLNRTNVTGESMTDTDDQILAPGYAALLLAAWRCSALRVRRRDRGCARQRRRSPRPQQSGIVARIVVQGNERIEQDTILSYLPIPVGDTVDPAKHRPGAEDPVPHRPVLRRRASSCRATTWWSGGREPDHQPGGVRGELATSRTTSCATRCTVRPRGIFTKRQGAGRRAADRRALPPLGPHLGRR